MTKEDRLARAAERRAQRQVPRTRLGLACGIIAVVTGAAAVLLTLASLAATRATYGVSIAGSGGLASGISPLLLTYLVGASLALGGLGMLLPKTWGWWLTAAAAVVGPLDLIRLYRRLFATINFDHPNVDEVIRKLVVFTGLPALFYVALIALLVQRQVRETYRVSV